MTEAERMWLAGWLEGEGSFFYGRELIVNAASTDLDSLERVQELAGGAIYFVGKRQPQHKDAWHWRICGAKAALLMAEVRPLMMSRRGKQIDSALLRWNARARRGDAIRKVPLEDRPSIRKLLNDPATPKGTANAVAAQYDVSKALISQIKRGVA